MFYLLQRYSEAYLLSIDHVWLCFILWSLNKNTAKNNITSDMIHFKKKPVLDWYITQLCYIMWKFTAFSVTTLRLWYSHIGEIKLPKRSRPYYNGVHAKNYTISIDNQYYKINCITFYLLQLFFLPLQL